MTMPPHWDTANTTVAVFKGFMLPAMGELKAEIGHRMRESWALGEQGDDIAVDPQSSLRW
jgi:hypothetical protein